MSDVKLLYGEEAFRLLRKKEEFKQVKFPEMNLIVTEEFTEDVMETAYQMPFLAPFRVILLELPDCKSADLLLQYLKQPAATTNLYVFVKDMDRRSSLYKAFSQSDIWEARKYSEEELKKNILHFMAKGGARITANGMERFLEYLDYYGENTNFFDVVNELEKLCAASSVIDEPLVRSLVTPRKKEDPFSLFKLITDGNGEELFKQARLILDSKEGSPLPVLGLLFRNYRIAYKASVLRREEYKEIGVKPFFIHVLEPGVSEAAMKCILEVTDGLKTGKYTDESGLITCLSKLLDLSRRSRGQTKRTNIGGIS